MSILNVSGLSLSYGITDILKSVTFAVNASDKVGVIGVNGAGKTTLLKLLTDEIQATSGTVSFAKGVKVGIMSQTAFVGEEDKTVYSVIYDSVKEEYKTKVRGYLKGISFEEETHFLPVSKLSGGQRTRLALVRLLLSESDIILLDEPTNHLDTAGAEWLEGVISSSKKTFIIVSHDRYFLDRTTTKTLEIENGTAVMYSGAYTEFKAKKKKLLEDAQKHYEIQQREIKRIEAFIENQRKWNRERNIIAAESREKALARMEKLEKPKSAPRGISFKISALKSTGNDVLNVRNVSKSFGGKKLFNVSFELKKGERLFITGANGAGKSTLMKILTGSLDADDGFFEYGYGQKIGYYDQDSQLLNENGTVIDELINCDAGLTITQIRTLLASFGFIGEDVFKNIDVLSGGERARLSICKLVLSGTSLLILDEPTNHLDIPSRETLENALKEYEGTVLSVSHDRYFASALATAILEIDTNSFSDGYTYFRGSYSDYQSKRRIYVDVESVSSEKKQASVDYKAAKEEKARRQKNAKRIVTLEKLIADSEARVAEIKSLSIGEYASDYVMLEQLANEQSELEEKITEYYEEYFNLTEGE